MAATITSLNSALSAALLAFVCTAHGAPLVKCPSVNADSGKTGLLEDADVFQGPPENKASIIPDLDTSEWDLHGYQENAEERGEALYLVCRYTGIKSIVSIEVPRAATFCRVGYTKSGKTAFCGVKSASRQNRQARRG